MAKAKKQSEGWRNRIIGEGVKPASAFTPNALNFRRHPNAQRNALRGVLNEVGWIQRVIENVRTGNLIDGHARIEEALSRDENEPVPYIQVDVSPEEEKLLLATLDPLSAMATSDKEVLDALLREVSTGDAAVQSMLSALAEDNGLYFGEEKPAQDAPDAEIDRAAELQEKWKVQRGDLYEIGRHRLLCGDSTSAEDVVRLMGGKKAQAVVTDSPYGIERQGIANDTEEGLRGLFDGLLRCLPATDAVVINFQSPRLFPVWVDAVRDAGHQFERALWFYDETDVTFPWRGWLMTSQIALVSSVGKPKWKDDGPYHHDTYMVKSAGKQDDVNGMHTTAKPLDIIEDLVGHTTGLLYEPFCGSGTAMVAAQRLNRECYGIELEPKYCAVILERMSNMGLTPNKIDG